MIDFPSFRQFKSVFKVLEITTISYRIDCNADFSQICLFILIKTIVQYFWHCIALHNLDKVPCNANQYL